MNQVLATERIDPLRPGISPAPTSLHGWTAADAKHLHQNIFIKTANLFAEVQVTLTCRGV